MQVVWHVSRHPVEQAVGLICGEEMVGHDVEIA
jgi:hypothetical protein